MAKKLVTRIQVNTSFTWIVVIKILVISGILQLKEIIKVSLVGSGLVHVVLKLSMTHSYIKQKLMGSLESICLNTHS